MTRQKQFFIFCFIFIYRFRDVSAMNLRDVYFLFFLFVTFLTPPLAPYPNTHPLVIQWHFVVAVAR